MTAFLADLTRRPLNLSETGANPQALYLGSGANALDVAVLESAAAPTITNLRTIWNARLPEPATPLLVVVRHGRQSSQFGPYGDRPGALSVSGYPESARRYAVEAMVNRTSPSDPQKPRFKTTGLNYSCDLRDLIGRAALKRFEATGDPASASALIVEPIERHRPELERELAAASR